MNQAQSPQPGAGLPPAHFHHPKKSIKRCTVATAPGTGREIIIIITRRHEEINVTVDLSGEASLTDLIVGGGLKRIVVETFDCD